MEPNFEKGNGLIVAVAQDAYNGQVLMQAYMNEESYRLTMETGYMHYYSRSRNCLWKKGETSGHLQKVIAAYIDCDGDSLLFKVEQKGAACHTGNRTCFYTSLTEHRGADYFTVFEDYQTILTRKKNPVEGSYTNYLFQKGLDKILKKMGEECTEVVVAAKNADKKELVMELNDLLYHSLVLMANEGITPEDIYLEGMNRQGKAPHPKYSNTEEAPRNRETVK